MPTTFTIFKEALQSRKVAEINALIARSPRILEETDENGISGFLYLAYYQLPKEVLTMALTYKPNVTLPEAIAAGLLYKVMTIINVRPVALHTFSADGFLPLTLACYFGQYSIADYLLKKGAKINTPANNPSKVTALHSAVARNDYEICKLLLENGAAANATQAQGVTALHAAAHRGNLQIVQLLAENGADIAATMANGDTAYALAKKDGHQTIADFLSK